MVIIFLLMGCSQICRAIHNTLWQHFKPSIFYLLNHKFWDEYNIACNNKYINNDKNQGHKKLFWFINVPDSFTSGWHIFNTSEIFSHFFTVITALYLKIEVKSIKDIVLFGVYACIAYNLPFNIFYNWLLIRNKTFKEYLKQSFNIK